MLNAAPTEVQTLTGFRCCKLLIVIQLIMVYSKLESLKFGVFLLFLQTVNVAVFYSKPQRLDVYVNDQLVAPNNAQ